MFEYECELCGQAFDSAEELEGVILCGDCLLNLTIENGIYSKHYKEEIEQIEKILREEASE
jgi:hypothetical protein